MFKRILIANRGEIALRVMRACHEMGIETVAVYSEADKGAAYLRLATDAICIGPAKSALSYLDIPRIMSAAEVADVEAIHPGFGFLSENAHFAEVCRSCGIQFIGPSPESIAMMGDKASAKTIARSANVPVIPGSDGKVDNEQDALRMAREIGFPIMIKAAAGGGGRGMRIARNEVSFVNGYLAARAEANTAFADPSVYLERLIDGARHVEVQIVGDRFGSIVSLGERDCTVQRRHQKLIEEGPSPAVDEDLRRRMSEAARRLAKAAHYENAGTLEFLLDRNGDFYFMEMNTRIQVEHPVTEEITGIDLIKTQIRVAAGEKLPFRQEDVHFQGWAIECRINAEDPSQQFRPCPGTITQWIPPGGRNVRLDTHAHAGYRIPPTYDSMVAKLLAKGSTREEAITTMLRALDEFVIEGVKTTIPLQREVLRSEEFRSARFDTRFVESQFAHLINP